MGARSPNKLLGALAAADYRRILPDLRSVHIANGDKLGQCGETRVYFPCAGLCSVRSEMEDGRRIEIASVGTEGVVGFAAITGDTSLKRSFLQITDGYAQYMPLPVFERELARGGPFSEMVERFSRTFIELAMQLAACNRLHTLEERYCRWLLITCDRIGRRRLEMNPATLAGALGAKQQQLAAITKTLQNLHVLDVEDHQIIIFDRQTLERFACDCYAVMKKRLADASGSVGPPAEDARPRPVSADIVRIRPVEVCGECGIAAGTPHRSDRECIRAIDAEMKLLLQRARRLQSQRGKIFEHRLKALRDSIDKFSPPPFQAYK